jgi:hypothetical protein
VSDAPAHPDVRAGLAAWLRGDLDALEAVLDPAVTLRAIRPGPSDCENRDEVMALLRARQATPSGDATVTQIDATTFLVAGATGDDEIATRVTVAGEKVIAMQQVATAQHDPDAERAVTAVRTGDLTVLAEVLTARPDLARARPPGHGGRTLLHIVTDWPGYPPQGPETVALLVAHGAEPDDRGSDDGTGETPLHWAASNDDVDVAAALLDGGADMEAPDGSIGTPLDNAIGYGCWHVARLLAAGGAKVDKLWHAAALGDLQRLNDLLALDPPPEQINQAFWHACGANQRRTAERLLHAGADLHWTPDYADGTPLDAATSTSTRQQVMIDWLNALGAMSGHQPT